MLQGKEKKGKVEKMEKKGKKGQVCKCSVVGDLLESHCRQSHTLEFP